MTDLSLVSDEDLLADTARLAEEERHLLTAMLNNLRELERRRNYGEHGSLYDYAVKQLGYEEPQAARRIVASELMEEVPELQAQIEHEGLTLTHISVAAGLFNNEKKHGRPFTAAMKLDVFRKLAGLSTRQAQRLVAEMAPVVPPRPDHIRALGHGRNLLRAEVTDGTLAKVEKVKGRLAHKYPRLSFDELLNVLCDVALERSNPARAPKRKVKGESKAKIKRAVWMRDGGACVECGSTYAVQVDHIVPRAMGGKDTFENMRLLCRKCNQKAAIRIFGRKKMDPHLN